MRPLQVLPLPHLVLLLLLLSAGTGVAHLGQPQVAPESPLEPKPPALMGDGQHTWARRRRHSPHFPLCSFCCGCCANRGCGFCCRT
ncbi:LOW QUALITY PROTEIN: hepcidin [Catharus ustulatus]|uniref:LOW QUALITY PROTEIN: hepcidin n=1 Tax=Catharus ustulatus TaxID=91951 RepID=UPI001408DB76|nr:LOW QUALITY PROTEIN: hepcidin [Catharus ustulatus]